MRVTRFGSREGTFNLGVELDERDVERFMENVFMVLAVQNDIRPQAGKHAKELVEETLGADEAAMQASRVIMSRALPLAVDEAGAEFVGQPRCSFKHAARAGEPFSFSVELAALPKVELESYDPVELPVEHEPVFEETVDACMREMAEKRTPGATLDDAWVGANVQGCASVDEFRRRIRAELERRNDQGFYEYCGYLAAAQLAERVREAMPDAAFKAHYEDLLGQFRASLAEQGETQESYLAKCDLTLDRLKAQLMSQAREQLRQMLALDALARHENLKVTDADMKEYFRTVSQGREEEMEAQLKEHGGMTAARRMALRMKANALAVEQAVRV